eukprot:TRINITY_DN28316_c0_g1_i1.p1 TRINITY_DN28316_c0_g1~~TRINITY_DN28316_c0_g1_i1.p1  ORF type:complete len:165 (-),score=27.32 TRINITY_DN28316_c0_g1_i1:168-662(-)
MKLIFLLPLALGNMVSSLTIETKSTTPHWVTLSCDSGHKYLFSETEMTWQDARAECKLYGGWLVEISGLRENNCLLKYAESVGLQDWWWTGGNDEANEGVFVHDHDGTELEWLSCWASNTDGVEGRHGIENNALIFGTYQDYRAGCWYDDRGYLKWKFICEGIA